MTKITILCVEAALNDFIDKILKDFVVNLWYSLIHAVIMDALGENLVKVKEINTFDLLTWCRSFFLFPYVNNALANI